MRLVPGDCFHAVANKHVPIKALALTGEQRRT